MAAARHVRALLMGLALLAVLSFALQFYWTRGDRKGIGFNANGSPISTASTLVDSNRAPNGSDSAPPGHYDDIYRMCMKSPPRGLPFKMEEVESDECRDKILQTHCTRLSGRVTPMEASPHAAKYLDDWKPTAGSLLQPVAGVHNSVLRIVQTAEQPGPPSKMPLVRLASLIFVHNNLRQFTRLVSAIWTPYDFFAVHVDANSPPAFHAGIRNCLARVAAGMPFSEEAAAGPPPEHLPPNVVIVPSQKVLWGGGGMTQATYMAAKLLLDLPDPYAGETGERGRDDPPWDFFINFSSTDYPISTDGELRAFLMARRGLNFANWDSPPKEAYAEIVECKRRMYKIGEAFQPRDMELHGGAQWFILSRGFCQWIVRSALSHHIKELVVRTPMPDERIVYCLLQNSPFVTTFTGGNRRWNLQRADKCLKERSWLFVGMLWCGTGPATVTVDSLQKHVLDRAVLWTRKFDSNVSFPAMQMIDQRRAVLRREWKPMPPKQLEQSSALFARLLAIGMRQAGLQPPARGVQVESGSFLVRRFLTTMPSEDPAPTWLLTARAGDGQTVRVRVVPHMLGSVSGRVKSSEVAEHLTDGIITSPVNIISPTSPFAWVQNWFTPRKLTRQARFEVIRLPPRWDGSARTLPPAVFFLTTGVKEEWSRSLAHWDAVKEPGLYLFRVIALPEQVVEAQHRVLATHDVSDRDTVPDGLLSELYDIQLDKES